MEMTKTLESTVACGLNNEAVETIDNFQSGYEIWFNNIYDDKKEASGLAGSFTNIESFYDTFDEALKVAVNFSEDIYKEYEVIIEQFFNVWDEDTEGYKSITIPLLTVDAFTQKEKQLVLTEEVLELLDEQFPEEEEEI